MPRHHRFTAFLSGSFLAGFGGWINFLAILNIATYRFDARPIDLVVLSAALLLPSVALTRVVGRVSSRYSGTRVITIALAVTLATTAGLLCVTSYPLFLAVIAVKSAALGFVDPSEMQYVTTTVEPGRQGEAFRMLALAQSIAKICAPAAGAVVGAWLGDDRTMVASLVLIAAAMVLFSLSAMAPARTSGTADTLDRSATTTQARPSLLDELRGAIAPLLFCFAITTALAGSVNNQFPLMLRQQGFDKSILGVVVSCGALGGVCGSLLYKKASDVHVGLSALLLPSFITSAMFIGMGVIFRLPLHVASILLAGAFLMCGIAGARLRVVSRMYIAQRLGDRVASASATLQSTGLAMQFAAPFLGAVMTTYLSNSNVLFAVGGMATVALACVALGFRYTAAWQTASMLCPSGSSTNAP